jgi:hypothetical protein
MGRPKKHIVPYTGDTAKIQAAFEEYLSCVADCFGEPYDDRIAAEEKRDAPSLRFVCEKFDISIPKARKLLITAGMYTTEQSRMVGELYAQGKSVAEIEELTGLKRSSVSSYLPYQKMAYHMEEVSRHTEDSRTYRERQRAVKELHKKIMEHGNTGDALWKTVIAYQNYPFHTSSGLPFSYIVYHKKSGEYGGELLVSRKEKSKTLTKSSVMLAFYTVLERIQTADVTNNPGKSPDLIPPEYKGPKAIGQIFGISYIYSLFWKWGLIAVPATVENRLRGKKK